MLWSDPTSFPSEKLPPPRVLLVPSTITLPLCSEVPGHAFARLISWRRPSTTENKDDASSFFTFSDSSRFEVKHSSGLKIWRAPLSTCAKKPLREDVALPNHAPHCRIILAAEPARLRAANAATASSWACISCEKNPFGKTMLEKYRHDVGTAGRLTKHPADNAALSARGVVFVSVVST